ncbi:hypothetical protein Tco_0612107, partial [Tanacetum coccineum]
KQIVGIRLTKPKPNMVYRRVEKGESSNNTSPLVVATTSTPPHDVPNSIKQGNALNITNDSDSEDVDEELVVEEDRRNVVTDNKN